MRLPQGTLQKASIKANLPPAKISDYAAARTRPRPKRAKHLEKTLGVSAATWILGTADEIKSALIKASK